MIRVPISLHRSIDESHDLRIGRGMGPRISVDLRRRGLAARYIVVTDTHLAPQAGRRLLATLRRRGLAADLLVIPAGEASKSRRVRDRLEDRLVDLGAGRDTAIVALGGGVVGDLAGFVAATYHRGIPFVQMPTTLIGMVDSAIGGKTGINHPAGKNLFGAYHQPSAIYIDVDYLRTLPARAYRSGLAEVVKYGVIADPEIFRALERETVRVLRRDSDLLSHLIEACCRIKARVVSEDPHENGRRTVLNFGHTIGHALETLSRYRLSHGEAVSIGMVIEARIAARIGPFPDPLVARLRSLLDQLGLPTSVPRRFAPAAVLAVARRDKKSRQGRIVCALPIRLGAMARSAAGEYGIAVEDRMVTAALLSRRR